ncbi:MAG: rhomboid family intramembrane serine protease [Burkholderiales bacterium]|nr:rhomboid family intramembrane serine protease [Bacteroidia bacterium]
MYYTHFLIVIILIFSVVGFVVRRFYFSCIFHPHTFPSSNNKHSIISYALVHFNYPHLILNMAVLYLFGIDLEIKLVALNMHTVIMPMVFISAALIGALLNLSFNKHKIEFSIVGASNGVFGVVAAYLILNPKETIHFMPLAIPNFYLVLLIAMICLINHKILKTRIDYFGHLGGLLMGATLMMIIK